MKTRARAVSSDNSKPTIVLNLPGPASLLLATYVAFMLAWNILSFVLALFAQAAAFLLVTFYMYTGLAMLSMKTTTSSTASTYNDIPKKKEFSVIPTLPLLCIDSTISSFKSAHVSKNKTGDTTASTRKELQAPARRRVLAQLNRNRLLVNVVPGDMRRRVDMNLGKAIIRVGKAFIQSVPGKRKPRDIYVVRVDCGAEPTTQEKRMNPVIMWDVTATFDEFKQLERDLNKEVRAKKQLRAVKVPRLSSGAVLFVQPELTNHVLNARRARLQTFIDTVRSDPVLSTTGSLRKFCQAY
ncbi:unnamed protein product [Peronospora destructor]|uniref:PX domain-containing protein n=1 Tax=Peronospora destructor TaxID=86335 RepID=A0AAV0VEW1_9STRA|nr:unnamed protein product [Peronospora destructor]